MGMPDMPAAYACQNRLRMRNLRNHGEPSPERDHALPIAAGNAAAGKLTDRGEQSTERTTSNLTKMWIIPNNLQLSNGAPDTEAFISDLNEQYQICASSLLVRSKHSPARTWSQKWKRDSWTRLLSGRILKPSHAKSFVTEWTCLWPVIHANHSPQPGGEQERMTPDTYGLGSQTEFGFCDQECASSRMSKDISRWDSPASSATWKSWVTRCRLEYLARVKLAHPTSASGCLSWPTANARDWKDSITGTHPPSRQNMSEQTLGQAVSVIFGLGDRTSLNTNGNRQESWATPSTMLGSMYVEHNADKRNSPSLATQAAWATPNNFCFQPPENTEQWTKRAEYQQTQKGVNLHKPIQSQVLHENEKVMGAMPPSAAKLNPRWVETLMGLPIGWTMPSCTRPVIPAPMSYAFSEMALCQAQPSEHLELF
jgi:hypothetical protein